MAKLTEKMIHVGFTEAKLKELDEKARAASMSRGSFIKALIMQGLQE